MIGTKRAFCLTAVRILALIFGVVGSSACLVSAAVVVEQTQAGDVGLASTNANVVIEESQGYDNFVINQEVEITAVHWTGAFFGVFNADPAVRPETDFVVQFLPDAAGNRPDVSSPIRNFSLDGGQATLNNGTDINENVIGTRGDGGAIVRYEADVTPFTLPAGEYWLSIQAQQTFADNNDPEWLWSLSNNGDSRLFSYDEKFDAIGTQPGVAFQNDTTFTLFGNSASSGVTGDFDNDGGLGAGDIDILSGAVRDGSSASQFDLDGNGSVNDADRTFWIESLAGTLLGDTDLNKQVNFTDFLALADKFGQTAGWAGGDADGDNIVRFADFVALATNFGLSSNASAASAVPEPSSQLSALMISFLILVRNVKRSRKSIDVTVVPVKLWESR